MNPEQLMHFAWGFARTKLLVEACKMNLFELLEASGNGMTCAQVKEKLGWTAELGSVDYLDALVSNGLLERKDNAANGEHVYCNTPTSAAFLIPGKPGSFHGLFVMVNDRLYGLWGNLGDALRTGERQSEAATGDGSEDLFQVFKEQGNEFVKNFALAMEGLSDGMNAVFAQKVDFSKYKSMADLGGSTGSLAKQVALKYPHMSCGTYDLSELESIAKEYISKTTVADRVKVANLDFFNDTFPSVDVITMARILHDWGVPKRKLLMQKAFDSLNAGGAFIAIDSNIDDDRRGPPDALQMSINMLLECGKECASEYTFSEFQSWAKEIGYVRCEQVPLMAGAKACIAHKA